MYALSGQLKNLPVVSLQTGQTVAIATRPLINPDSLELIAFFCQVGRWQLPLAGLGMGANTVVLASDFRQISPDGILVNSVDEIQEASEIVRLQPIVEHGFKLLGKTVINESGQRLGRVEDYTVNLRSLQIKKLYVRQSWLKNLLMNNLIIDRTQITDVTQKHIVVRDATVKGGVTEAALSPRPVTPPIPPQY